MRLFVRLIAVVPWGVAFFVALLAVLVILGLNGTFLNPTFYQDQLKDADIYRFALVDVLESALDEARQLPPEEFGIGFRDNPLVASGLSTSQLAGAVRNALSPDDLEELLAPSVLGFGEYMAGEKDEIDLTIDASGHISGIADEALALLRDSGAYDRIFEKDVEPRIREAAGDILPVTEDASGWPEYLFGSGEEAEDGLVRVVKSAVTSEWLAAQAERALPVLTAYLVGNTDTFEIRIRLDHAQAAAATEETKAIVRETNLYDLVFDGCGGARGGGRPRSSRRFAIRREDHEIRGLERVETSRVPRVGTKTNWENNRRRQRLCNWKIRRVFDPDILDRTQAGRGPAAEGVGLGASWPNFWRVCQPVRRHLMPPPHPEQSDSNCSCMHSTGFFS